MAVREKGTGTYNMWVEVPFLLFLDPLCPLKSRGFSRLRQSLFLAVFEVDKSHFCMADEGRDRACPSPFFAYRHGYHAGTI